MRGWRRARPVIALDGSESIEGRALFAISALYWCAEWLHHVEVRLIDVSAESVVLATDVLRWDLGVTVGMRRQSAIESALSGVDLYAAAAFRSTRHLRLSEAAHAGIPTMVALQFPEPEQFGAFVPRQRAAFDPRAFAAEMGAIVKPWL
jgi:hypothetical protein